MIKPCPKEQRHWPEFFCGAGAQMNLIDQESGFEVVLPLSPSLEGLRAWELIFVPLVVLPNEALEPFGVVARQLTWVRTQERVELLH